MSDRKVIYFDGKQYLNKGIDGHRWRGPIMDRPQYGGKEDELAIELKPKDGYDVDTKDEYRKLGADSNCIRDIHAELYSLAKVIKGVDPTLALRKDLTNAFIKVCKAYDHAVDTLPAYEGFDTNGGEAWDIKDKNYLKYFGGDNADDLKKENQ